MYTASKLLKFEPEVSDPDTLRIVLYSPTGEGKSLLGNRIAGDNSEEGLEGPFVPSDSVESKTQEIKKVFIRKGIYKYPVSLTDQPGESDSTGRDREHATNLVSYLKGIEYIHAVVLVKNYQDVRVSDAYQSMLKNLEAMLGRNVWKHMVIVMTRVEGPKAKKASEYGKEFSNKIRDILKLTGEEAPLPIIYLSNFEEKYLEPLQKLVNEIVPRLGKFHCDSLHSPLDELQVGATLFPLLFFYVLQNNTSSFFFFFKKKKNTNKQTNKQTEPTCCKSSRNRNSFCQI
ncbi:AIG1 family protein [Reticulomyxa filosa]|uniref:AIG1 family protein n=1 Tax=Reticulomyxa filosa TaxID=46433 RepID=X6M2R5_RETFI|nr:AIG1 family protein [Reticulomyxa filosa]|eukprot:ETO07737.1 AIG1 family protein [Reticulomyxa filosa]